MLIRQGTPMRVHKRPPEISSCPPLHRIRNSNCFVICERYSQLNNACSMPTYFAVFCYSVLFPLFVVSLCPPLLRSFVHKNNNNNNPIHDNNVLLIIHSNISTTTTTNNNNSNNSQTQAAMMITIVLAIHKQVM